MRRWLWPYAILVIVLLLVGIGALAMLLSGLGPEGATTQVAVFNAVVIEPARRLLVSKLDMLVPFDLPGWFKQVYAVVALIAVAGLALSTVAGLVLLPVFYALYRDAGR